MIAFQARLLERGPQLNQIVAARLAWNEVKGTEPKTVRVALDWKTLAARRIVWLEGAHLPQRTRLAEGVQRGHLAP